MGLLKIQNYTIISKDKMNFGDSWFRINAFGIIEVTAKGRFLQHICKTNPDEAKRVFFTWQKRFVKRYVVDEPGEYMIYLIFPNDREAEKFKTYG